MSPKLIAQPMEVECVNSGPPSFPPTATDYSSYFGMATNIHGQSRSSSYSRYGQRNSLNQFQAGAVRGGLNAAGCDQTYYTYAQAPSVGGTSQSLFSQLSGSDRTYNTYTQAPSVGAVKQTVVSQVSSNYQIYSNLQPPSVGAVRQTFASQFSGNHQGYSTQPQAPSVGAVRQTVVSQLSGSDKTYSGGQPPTSNTLRTRSKNNYKDVSEKSDSALYGKNSGTHKRASFIGNGVPSTGKKVSSTGDEAFAMSLGLDAYGQANHETDLFSFPNLEDYKSIARHYRHRRPKGD
ncbi:hypothetical protein L2E82_22508 [Cichorium intybus]|uniref:Uncharacterized protein n=1 Tax=Cichorium intybus TaxID=13427 RepID=A0ACB9DYX5_CICIN|nr:hypothetical protein L2E82_22508 [Cichorium intybus]